MAKYPQDSAIRQLFQKGQPQVFGKKDIILGNAPNPDGVYFIDSGFVKIYSIRENGDESLQIIYGPGELFPIIWAYLDMQADALFYEAISDCTVWRISKENFTKYVSSDAAFGYAMSLQLAQQFRAYTDRLDNLEYKKAGERVAYRLLFLASRFGVKQKGQLIIEAPITHEIFGNSINLARESVSRQIELLEHEGIIKTLHHRLIIKNIAALEAKLSRPASLGNWQLG